MSASRTSWLVLAAAAALLAGCAARPPLRSVDWAAGEAPAAASARDVDDLNRAVAAMLDEEYARAAVMLLELGPRFEALGDDRRAAECLFWLGFCREKQGRTSEAAEFYRRVLSEHPDQPAARQAADRLSLLAAE